MRLLGLDVGEARVGVALSDPAGVTAQPLETVPRDDKAAERIAEIAREAGAETLVVGLPLRMDGTEGKQVELVRDFAESLAARLEVPLEYVDERLTTREAEAVLVQGGVKRGRKKEASDRLAAALILRTYMDSLPGE